MVTIYITKYALTKGIQKVKAELVNPTMAAYHLKGFYGRAYVHGEEFQMSPEAALARAEEMRTAKLKSLDKQHKKVSCLEFKIHELN